MVACEGIDTFTNSQNMAAETPTYKFSDYDKLKPVLIEK